MNEETPNGRIPPNDSGAESAILGSILQEHEKVLELCAEKRLRADDFYVPAHKLIFKRILKMASGGQALDALTLHSALRDAGELDKVGGFTFVDRLIDLTPTTAHAEYYIDIVKVKAHRREIISICHETIQTTQDEETKPLDALNTIQAQLFKTCNIDENAQTNAEAIQAELTKWEDARNGKVSGMPCFLADVQPWLGHFRYGKVYFVGAEPGRGKSTFLANQFDFWAGKLNQPCAVASLEMEHGEFIGRILAERADESAFALDTGMTGNVDRDGKDRLDRMYDAATAYVDADTGENKVPLFITDKLMTMDELELWTRLMVSKHGIQALGIDYMQLMAIGNSFNGKPHEELAAIGKRLVKLAKELHIIIVVLSQLRGEARGDRPPRPADLFGSRSMQDLAYAIIMLYQCEEMDFCDIQKNRGGRIKKVEVEFEGNRQRYKCKTNSVAEEWDDINTDTERRNY